MRNGNRISGIDIIGNVPWGIHFCQFYRTKEDLIDILIPYFKAGLEDNEYCVWALSEPIDKEEAKEALKVAIPNIDTYLENGQIEIIPYTYWHLEEDALDTKTVLNHLIEKTSKALASGYDGLRYSGNYFFGHEKLLDSAIGKYPMMALCTYSLDMCSSIDIIEIAANHQFALGKNKGKWEQIECSCQKNNKGCKQTEKALQESEDRYKAVFDNSLDGIFITIPDGTILAANPAACQMFGMTEEEILQAGRNGTVDTSDPRLKYFLEERARTGRFKGELNHRRKDGTIFPGEISSTLFKDKNDITKGIMIIRDITERKKVEEALRESEEGFCALVTASSEMVYRVSPDWSEMRYFYGRGFLANTESPNPTWLHEYVLPEDQPRVTAIINEAIRTKSTYQTEHRVRLADGSLGWIFSRAVPTLDANGEIVEWFGAASNITERKKAEEALKLSNIYNRSLIEASLDPLVTIGRDGKITDVNGATEQVTGYPRNELIGTDFSDYFTEPEEARKGYQQVFMRGEVRDYPLEIQHKDGSMTPVLYNASVYRDENGEVIGVFAAARDIAEIQKAGEKIQALANAVESSEDAIITKSLDGIITSWNKGAEQVYGYSAKEVLGKDITILEPENLKGEVKLFSEKIKQGEKIQHYETSRLKKDGTIINVSVTLSPVFDASEELVAVSTIARDITERKKAEEAIRLSNLYNRSLIEASLDPMVTIGPDGKITDVNGATEQVTGYSRNELIGTDFSDYFTEPEKARTGYQQVFKDGEVRDYPLGIQHKDGRITPVLYHASVYRDKNRKVIGVFAAARDITERKRAEAKLKDTLDNLDKLVKERTAELQKAYDSLEKSERNLAEAQEMAHIGSWERDFANNELHWSDETYRIFGLKPQESKVNYDTFLNYVHPDDRNYIDNAVKETLNGKPFDIDYRIITAKGEERITHEKAEVVFDEKKNPVRFIGTIQDITEYRKAEERIQNLANVVESSTEAIITKSFEGIIKSWNKGAEQVYGYSAEEVLGKPISALEPPTLTGETERLCKMVQQGEKVQQYETLKLRKDGKLINVSLTIFPVFDNHGKITAASIIATDITRRKEAEEKLRESEEKYRNIVETANELILITDNEDVITYVNKRMLDMLGYTMEESIGRPVWGFISEECRPIVKTNLEKRRQGRSESYELKLIRKDGSSFWTFLNAKPLFNKDGKYVGAMSMLTDITERKKAEEVLANIETARKKEIHHRIKNNLQVISSLLDLQAEQFRNREEIRDYEVLEAFRESQDRVISMALIHEELYRGEELDKLNFSLYIEELANTLFQTYRLGNTDISLNMDLEENLFFDMDTAVPLGIIVNELVSNSLKHAFSDRKKGEIQIKLHREMSTDFERKGHKSASFVLTISDNGVGIPENLDIENLDSLGMQLVTSLVDQLDGELELKRDNGTEFTIRSTVT